MAGITNEVTELGHQHVGGRVVAKPLTDEGHVEVEGVIRWLTFTSDTVVIAIEAGEGPDPDGGAIEWNFNPGETVTMTAYPNRSATQES